MKDEKIITLNKESWQNLCPRFFQHTHLMKPEISPFKKCTSVSIF